MKPAACYWSEGRFPHLISRENPPVRSSEEDIEQAIGACVLMVIELVYPLCFEFSLVFDSLLLWTFASCTSEYSPHSHGWCYQSYLLDKHCCFIDEFVNSVLTCYDGG